MLSATSRSEQIKPDVLDAANGLTLESLQVLIAGDALAVRVHQFASNELCKILSERVEEVGYKDYLNAPTVGRIGMSFYETGGESEIRDLFFETALPNIRLLRSACAPYVSPMDVLRCGLDEVWPAGANLQSLSGRKMFVGLSRNMRPGTPLLAHHDVFSRLAPNDIEANDLLGQFAANIYLNMPEEGGELVIWKNELPDSVFLERRGEKYGMHLEELGEPDVVITPRRGDFIIFNARKMHAVAAGKGSDRLTFSCFVGYRGADKPLTFWS